VAVLGKVEVGVKVGDIVAVLVGVKVLVGGGVSVGVEVAVAVGGTIQGKEFVNWRLSK
jgi:hypothetical protein